MAQSSSDHQFSKHPSPSRQADPVSLSFQGSYLCPVCRHGQITGLTLMDAFACNFCRHIFTANLTEQSVQVVDSSQPMAWRWNGRRWRVAYRGDDLHFTPILWLMGFALVSLPPAIVGLSVYMFPPLPNSRLAWLPTVWVSCTFLLHFLMVAWLVVEYYQFPFYVSGKIRLRALFNQR